MGMLVVLELISDLLIDEALLAIAVHALLKSQILLLFVQLEKAALFFQIFVFFLQQIKPLFLDKLSGDPILAIQVLNQISLRTPHGVIILDHDVLQGLDQSSLHIPSLGCFDGGINEPFSSSHGMKEEFRGRQALTIGIRHESPTSGAEVIF